VIRDYADHRLAEKVPHKCSDKPHACRPVAAATVNRELAMLRRMLRLGAKDGKVARVPAVELLREAPARAGFVDELQYRSLQRHLRPDLRVVVAVAFTFGWRARSEILSLQRAEVDLNAGTLRLPPGRAKNREARLIYMTGEIKQLVAEQHARVDALGRRLAKDRGLDHVIIPHLFPHLAGPHRGERIEEFRKAWKRATERAGLPGLLVHDLRRAAVRRMELAAVPRSVAMKLTGHKTESVYRRYAISNDADLRQATRRLGTLSGTLANIEGNGVSEVRDTVGKSR
jgi:integrase